MNLEQTEKHINETATRIANEIGGTVTVDKSGNVSVTGKKRNWVDEYKGYDPAGIYICEPYTDYELSVNMSFSQADYLIETGQA
jgi:hypothetical protein